MHFLPQDISHPSVLTQLNASIAKSVLLRGSIAYWTIPPSSLHSNFFRLLTIGSPSFCCVDLQLPTKAQNLAHFFARGAHQFYLHCRRLKTNDKYHSTSRLLHTKLLLLDFPDGEAEIWIGSHNFTAAALTGLNLEASMVIPCTQGSDLYEKVRVYLEHIRSKCHLFDPSRIADYLALQGIPEGNLNDDLYDVLDLITDDIMRLPSKTVLLLGDHKSELRRFQVAGDERGRPSLVEVLDRNTGQSRLMRAAVQSSGSIHGRNATSYGITFTPRPYAIRLGGLPAFVNIREKEFGRNELRPFNYWVNIELTKILPITAQLLAPTPRPKRAEWVTDGAATNQIRTEQDYLPNLFNDYQTYELRNDLRQTLTVQQPDFLAPEFSQASQRTVDATSRTLEQELDSVNLFDVQAFYEEWFQRRFFSPEAQRGALAFGEAPIHIPEHLKRFKRKLL